MTGGCSSGANDSVWECSLFFLPRMKCPLAGTNKRFLINTIKNTLPSHKEQDPEQKEGSKEPSKSQSQKEENRKQHRGHPYKPSFQARGGGGHSPHRKRGGQEKYEKRSKRWGGRSPQRCLLWDWGVLGGWGGVGEALRTGLEQCPGVTFIVGPWLQWQGNESKGTCSEGVGASFGSFIPSCLEVGFKINLRLKVFRHRSD